VVSRRAWPRSLARARCVADLPTEANDADHHLRIRRRLAEPSIEMPRRGSSNKQWREAVEWFFDEHHPGSDTSTRHAVTVAKTFSGQVDLRAGRCNLGQRPYIWPAGYRVRFHPTELIGPNRHVIARAGDRLAAGGGVGPPGAFHGPCTDPSMPTWLLQSIPTKG